MTIFALVEKDTRRLVATFQNEEDAWETIDRTFNTGDGDYWEIWKNFFAVEEVRINEQSTIVLGYAGRNTEPKLYPEFA